MIPRGLSASADGGQARGCHRQSEEFPRAALGKDVYCIGERWVAGREGIA